MMAYPSTGLRECLKDVSSRIDFSVDVNLDAVPVSRAVRGACRELGIDPFDSPTAGAVVMIVRSEDAERTLDAVRRSVHGSHASVIGVIR